MKNWGRTVKPMSKIPLSMQIELLAGEQAEGERIEDYKARVNRREVLVKRQFEELPEKFKLWARKRLAVAIKAGKAARDADDSKHGENAKPRGRPKKTGPKTKA